jgi:cytochrome c-type biogenesis protein CcmH
VSVGVLIGVMAAAAVLFVLACAALLARGRATRKTPSSSSDLIDSKARLLELRTQHEQGLITDDAYDVASREIAAALVDRPTGPPARPFPATGTLQLTAATCIGVLVAGGIYVAIGKAGPPQAMPAAVDPAVSAKPAGSDAPAHPLTNEQLQRMVEEVSAKLKKDPKDAAAWAMLAHSYEMMGQYDKASEAYAKLVTMRPDDAQVLADYADALAVAQGRKLDGEPLKLIQKALGLDPRNVKALALAGTAAFERKDYVQARTHWQAARAASTDDVFNRQIDDSLAEIAALTGTAAASPAAASVPGGQSAFVEGRVSIASALLAKASPDDTVFIFARPVIGSRMPVALIRKRVRDLPLDFKLDDTMAMVAEQSLSKHATVLVGARISKQGDAAPHAGDLQGISGPVKVGTGGIKLEINDVVQ